MKVHCWFSNSTSGLTLNTVSLLRGMQYGYYFSTLLFIWRHTSEKVRDWHNAPPPVAFMHPSDSVANATTKLLLIARCCLLDLRMGSNPRRQPTDHCSATDEHSPIVARPPGVQYVAHGMPDSGTESPYLRTRPVDGYYFT